MNPQTILKNIWKNLNCLIINLVKLFLSIFIASRNSDSLARDFFLRVCRIDPDTRYSALEALKHPWITRKFDSPIHPSRAEKSHNKIIIADFTKIIRTLVFANLTKENYMNSKYPIILLKESVSSSCDSKNSSPRSNKNNSPTFAPSQSSFKSMSKILFASPQLFRPSGQVISFRNDQISTPKSTAISSTRLTKFSITNNAKGRGMMTPLSLYSNHATEWGNVAFPFEKNTLASPHTIKYRQDITDNKVFGNQKKSANGNGFLPNLTLRNEPSSEKVNKIVDLTNSGIKPRKFISETTNKYASKMFCNMPPQLIKTITSSFDLRVTNNNNILNKGTKKKLEPIVAKRFSDKSVLQAISTPGRKIIK